MYVGELTMAQLRPVEQEIASEVINDLLCALRINGQICGTEWPVAITAKEYMATVLLPEKSALDSTHAHRWVREAQQRLLDVGLAEPEVRVKEDLMNERSCECDSPPSYILYTTFLFHAPPLRCGNCFLPVALYRVPPMRGTVYQDILSWEGYYKACDTLAMGSGPLEKSAMDQVSCLDSDLSQNGVAICRDLYEAMKIPVYYSLHHYLTYSAQQDQARLCPSCHGEWLLPTPWHRFDFRCDRCHLVSDLAPEGP